MSARQNKRVRTKRVYRDRTVTTLTGNDRDQDHSFFPIAGHDASANFVQSPTMMPSNFGFGFNSFVGPMNNNNNGVQQQQQQQQPLPYFPQQQPILPPGQNDLEILENLKERIKRGQHEFFRVAPTPAALESLYLGPKAAEEDEKKQALRENESTGVISKVEVRIGNNNNNNSTFINTLLGLFNSCCTRELQQEPRARTSERKRQQEQRGDRSELACQTDR